MVMIPGGHCMMGSRREEIEACIAFWSDKLVDSRYTEAAFRQWIEKEYPAHPVTIPGFAIAKYPTMNGQYARFCRENDCRRPESIERELPADHPVWGVPFEEAQQYVRWLGSLVKKAIRLPTEAEWEFAARGSERWQYPYGNTFNPALANTMESGVGCTTPVTTYAHVPTPFGLCDMGGNVEEWVDSEYAPYPGGPVIRDDLATWGGEQYHVLRGGSFARGGDLSRCARRHGRHPAPEFRYTGFRVACSVPA